MFFVDPIQQYYRKESTEERLRWHASGGWMVGTPSRAWSTVWLSVKEEDKLMDAVKLRGLLGLHVKKVSKVFFATLVRLCLQSKS